MQFGGKGLGKDHLSWLRLAVSQPRDKVLTVVSGDAVRHHVAHHAAGLPHDGVAVTRLVLVVQEVVDLETVETDHLPDLLTPHLRSSAVKEHRQVTEST